MDAAFVGSLRRLSTSPEGNPEFGGPDQQTIGIFSTTARARTTFPSVLVRVADPNSGKIWLFSSETLSKVPDCTTPLRLTGSKTDCRKVWCKTSCSGCRYWQWLALLAAIPVAIVDRLGNGSAAGDSAASLAQVQKSSQPSFLPPHVHAAAALFQRARSPHYRHTTSACRCCTRLYYSRIIGVLVSIGFFWFLLRVTSLTMQRLRAHAISSGRLGTGTLIVLGERLLTALVVVICVLAVLGILGFNLTTVLAGLGIGGIAIAFAAQKTLENLFGGISVLADEVIRVGDYCRFGDRTGTVEDISLRSTRVRTDARTELSIPNGALATMNIENFTRRDKIHVQSRARDPL